MPKKTPVILGIGMENKETLEVYFCNDGWAYLGVYQTLGNLPGLTYNEKSWTLFGALLLELLRQAEYNIVIYHDTRLVDEWDEEVGFMSKRSQGIAARLKNEYADRFSSLEIRKLDNRSIRLEMERLKLG